jgi:DNA mismatch endonuclease (patch repair protein)
MLRVAGAVSRGFGDVRGYWDRRGTAESALRSRLRSVLMRGPATRKALRKDAFGTTDWKAWLAATGRVRLGCLWMSLVSPPATTPGRSRNMAAIRRRDTTVEREVRSLLHARGFRFRVDMPIRVDDGRPVRPDIVFTRRRVAVFCDGCFWHGCSIHGRRPRVRNPAYWVPKIEGNMARDVRQTTELERLGWIVLRFWEHESPDAIVKQIAAVATSVILPGAHEATERG